MISTFICTAVMNFQVNIEGVCSENPPMRFYCPGPNTFFTASVLWGTIGPLKVFGHNGQYGTLLLGFPLGIIVTLLIWLSIKYCPARYSKLKRVLRQLHPVALFFGGVNFAPYSFSYAWPAVPVAWLSWIYVRSRYLAFWSKYNFVLSAAFSAGIAIAGIVMLFSVQWAELEVSWWGNNQPYEGCEASGAPCRLVTLTEGERFYPWWNGDLVPAP